MKNQLNFFNRIKLRYKFHNKSSVYNLLNPTEANFVYNLET